MARWNALWGRLSGSLWFLPTLIVACCAVLAVGLMWLDRVSDFGLARSYPLVFGSGVEGSRGVLSAIASSVITVAGVVFSITTVALSLASSQYSPRVLRTFMADRPTQIVLGAFVGIFTYCLLVLRTIGDADDVDPFVPTIAVLTGTGLAIVGVTLLVYFIHHVATSIQASSILERVADETLEVIDRVYPDALEDVEERDPRANHPIIGWPTIGAPNSGYVQEIDFTKLAEFAAQRDLVLRIDTAVGAFAVAGAPILQSSGPLSEQDQRELRGRFKIGSQRSGAQDVAFGIQQIVDVALKGLSPGINDTTTALMCIDRLSSVLCRLTQRRMLPRLDPPEFERLVMTQAPDFGSLLGGAFDAIRRNGAGNPDVLCRLIRCAEDVMRRTASPARRALIAGHVSATLECAQRTVAAKSERDAVRIRAQKFFGTSATPSTPASAHEGMPEQPGSAAGEQQQTDEAERPGVA